VQWTIKVEARTEWGETRTFEIGRLTRHVAGLTSHEVGLTLDEGKALLAELQRRVVQSQIDEKRLATRICSDCLSVRPIRDRRTRVLQTLFGTVRVAAPRIKLCVCVDKGPFDDMSFSPLSELLPDRCTPELRRLQAELGARHSLREAARLLGTLLPCSPPNHASVRNRLHRVAEELHAEAVKATETISAPAAETASDPGIVVAIDGAHIRAAPGYQTRHVDVTVGKVEAAGRPPRPFALAPSGTERPLLPVRAALAEQGWRPDLPVTVISDAEAALPELVRRATGGDVTHILDGSVANPGSRCMRSRRRMLSGGDSKQRGNEGGLRRHVPTADVVNLPLPDHRHRLVASQCRPGSLHAAKPKPWPNQPFDAAVVLLDDVVQVFALSQPREAP